MITDEKMHGLMEIFISKLTDKQMKINEYFITRNRIESVRTDISLLQGKLSFLTHKDKKGTLEDKERDYMEFIPSEIERLKSIEEGLKIRLNIYSNAIYDKKDETDKIEL